MCVSLCGCMCMCICVCECVYTLKLHTSVCCIFYSQIRGLTQHAPNCQALQKVGLLIVSLEHMIRFEMTQFLIVFLMVCLMAAQVR